MINKNGYFNITPKLTDYDRYYLFNFHATPHLKRKTDELKKYFDGSNGYNGNYGIDGEFFIKDITDDKGIIIQNTKNVYNVDEFDTIVDFKSHPQRQPSVDCPWKPNKDGTKILTSDGIDFYQHEYGWIKWIIKNILKDKYTLNGEYISKKNDDERIITIKNNKVNYKSKKGNVNKPASISLSSGKLTIQNLPIKKKTEDQIITDIINRTKNGELIWEKEVIISSIDDKYTSSVSFDGGVEVVVSLFIRKHSSINNYISIYVKRDNSLKFYKSIRNYFIRNLVKIVKKST